MYSSNLTTNSPTFSPDCRIPDFYYNAVQISVVTSSWYRLWSASNIVTYGYIYKDNFNPLIPFENLLTKDDGSCGNGQFWLRVYLEANIKYILVVTTYYPNVTGTFFIHVIGRDSVVLNLSIITHNSCWVGGRCRFYTKSIGITLDDILRDEIRRNMTLNNQKFMVKMSAALTMIMAIAGLINSILSFLTFQNKELRQVGCGMYLLAPSVTSLLTICMFVVKFWFVIFTHMNTTFIQLSLLQAGCKSIEFILQLFLYLDTWFNGCVAVERAISVFKGINFNKKKSRHIARWIILILPFCIMATIIQEPIHRELIEYNEIKHRLQKNKIERHVWCLSRYSPLMQNYNTAILFFHLLGPFIANLFSAAFIIFGTTRQRSTAQNKKTYQEHLHEQLREHKQLLISPIILVILALPRLIISLLYGCLNVSDYAWLYLTAYFISFIPSILVFVVFVLPSELYRKKFKESLLRCCRRRQQTH
ncbi:unnamed protein product [Rotaria sp. Silwood2]|nr:unnamed protein product [Rotaria sp. Silwood2]